VSAWLLGKRVRRGLLGAMLAHVLLCSAVYLGVSEPLFPNGVGAIMESVAARQQEFAAQSPQDSANLNMLKEAGAARLERDLAGEMAGSRLQEDRDPAPCTGQTSSGVVPRQFTKQQISVSASTSSLVAARATSAGAMAACA
jgi:hypothetical protein